MSKVYNKTNTASAIILRPRITEKSNVLSMGDTPVYSFEVSARANKLTVAKAFKDIYKLTPVKVAIVVAKPKNVISRGRRGVVSGFKKAMVYLKKGDKIDFA